MERGKTGPGRGGKSKAPQHPANFIALGSKGSRPDLTDPKRSGMAPKAGPSSSVSGLERKRDPTALASMPPIKKPKLDSVSKSEESWDNNAIECDPADLVASISQALENEDNTRARGLLSGGLSLLRRGKTDRILLLSLLLVGKQWPKMLTSEVPLLCHILQLKVQKPQTHMVACALLMKALQHQTRWPENLARIYAEDAVGDRYWVDLEEARPLVENINVSFGTRKPSRPIQTSDTPMGHCDSPARDEDDVAARRLAGIDAIDTGPPMARFDRDFIKGEIEKFVQENATNRSPLDPNYRNLVRFMVVASGLSGVRLIASQKLDAWLTSPKLLKTSHELLLSVCANCISLNDKEVVGHIVKIKFKSKNVISMFLSGVRELVNAFPDNLGLVLKLVVYNELSSTRNQTNMNVLTMLFQTDSERSAKMLAEVFHELLMQKDDYLKAIRNFLRELVRNVRNDFKVIVFCRTLMRDRSSDQAFLEFNMKDRMLQAIADLVCLCILVSITHSVKEAYSLLARGDQRELRTLVNYQNMVANVQQDAVYWLQVQVVKMYNPPEEVYLQVMRKVLFLEPGDQYHAKDSWPPESERSLMYRLAMEVPVLFKTLMMLCIICSNNDHSNEHTNNLLDIMERIVKRAATIANDLCNPLLVENVDLLTFLIDSCVYKHPQHYNFPSTYCPPKLAKSHAYWKGWSLAVILAAFNPTTIGALGWEKYPTLRALMEMCITNTFQYPPPTMAAIEEDVAKEAQIAIVERRQILEYETLLGEQEKPSRIINEQNSHFLQTLTMFDPTGPARRPPQATLAELKAINDAMHLGHRLCQCRNPDFLLDVIHRQGTSQAMPWLAELVNSNDGSLCLLPVPCLCEFLLCDLTPFAEHSRHQKHQQLVDHLKNMLAYKEGPEALTQCIEVLDYFMRRLGSPQACSRLQGIKALRLLLDDDDDDVNSNAWLLDRLPSLPHFSKLKSRIILALRQACLSENDISTLRCYLRFLAEHAVQDANPQNLAELTVDMATLVVERNNITHMLLPSRGQQDCDEAHSSLANLMEIFIKHIVTSRVPRRESYAWSHSQDHIRVEWPTEECYLHILVVHASVLLLTYGQGRHHHLFNRLHEIWLGPPGPKGTLTDTFEEAVLFPDWLKLKMIQSEAPGLVEAALADLEAPQLLLFAQNFGIPPSNMSLLLMTLDHAVDHDPQAVTEAIQDRAYMVQLVKVQHHLGAKNGHRFLHFLDPSNQSQVTGDEPEEPNVVVRRPLPLQMAKAPEPKAVSSLVPSLFSEDCHEARAAFSLIHKTVCNELAEGESGLLLSILHHVVREIRNRPSFAHYALARPLLLWPLVRLAVSSRPTPAIKEALSQLAEQLKCTNTPMTHMLASSERKPKVRISRATVAEEATQRLLLQHPTDSTGHLLDSLATLETVPIEQQMQLLFGRGHTTCRPYLLTLLTHGSTWSTLHNCMTHLLKKADPGFDPSAVLDFLWALIGNPKLWQGRDKKPSKHQVRDDILGLSLEQTCVLLDYVLEEALVVGGQELSDGRVALLLQCLSLEYLRPLVRHLATSLQSADKAAVGQQLLLQLYLAMPVLINELNDFEKDLLIEGTNLGTCALDISSHSLLSALASSTGPPKDWIRRSQDYELAARKMTATHPLLVLRQLPMLASSLQGRVHYESGVFRHRNHLLYFMQVLGLLEVLQPHIFQTEYAQSLELILDSFFAMFQLHNQLRDVQIALTRTVALLQSFVSYDAQRALKYLQRHCQLLHDLHAAYPNVSGLQPLLAGLSLPARDGDEPEVLVAAAAVGAAEAQQPPTAVVSQIVGRLGRQQTEDVQQQALQELEHASSRRPAVLEGCVDMLASLLLHPSIYTRNLAHVLLLRYLRYNPTAAAASVTTFIQCLESSNPDIQASAIEKIPELVVCAQEHALTILKKLGKLGVEQGVNTTPVILRTVSLLQLQNGC